MIAKKLFAAMTAIGITLLSGCAEEVVPQKEANEIVMTAAVSIDAPQSLKKAAREFANRTAYYSDGELQISLQEVEDSEKLLWGTDFAFVENSTLTEKIPNLKTLELPFFFKHEDYHFSALNSEETIRHLNGLLKKEYPLEVRISMLCGYKDYAADIHANLENFKERHTAAVEDVLFSDSLQNDLSVVEIDTEEPVSLLKEGKTELAHASLSELVLLAKENPGQYTFLKTPWRLETAYLLSKTGMMENLTPKQQAAIEQAAVMASGYCRTLTQEQREEEKQELQTLGVTESSVNIAKYFDMMGDIYQYQQEEMLFALDTELDRLIRRNGVKETF